MNEITAAITTTRRDALAEAVTAAEQAHARFVASYGADRIPAREVLVAAVLDEAIAWWAVETRQGRQVQDVAAAQRYAARHAAWLAETAEGIAWEQVPAATRTAVRREVLVDMIGETD